MTTVIKEFDAVSIKNASIQFFDNGVQQPGTPFGLLGSVEGETEVIEIVKKAEGVEVKRKSKPIKMTNTVSGHIPVKVARDFFGLKADGLKPGVWSYGTLSAGKKFTFTADVIDEFEDVVKLIAFPNCSDTAGFKIAVENGADEVAMLELEFTALPDEAKQIYYEALVDELDDPTVAEKWHTKFERALVEPVPAP
ncbi:phage tail protein [Neobacillus niacini]|uniref:phage tail protein n=1 Tax=Neobacillus niacini TaxID=86668 RepID=UPI002FFFFEE0